MATCAGFSSFSSFRFNRVVIETLPRAAGLALILAALTLSAPFTVQAQTPEAIWGHSTSLLPGQTFKTFDEAESEMKKPTTHIDAPWLERGGEETNFGSIIRNYSIAPIGAEFDHWEFQDGLNGGPLFGSEGELMQHLLAPYQDTCSKSGSYTGGWGVVEDQAGFTVSHRDYTINWEVKVYDDDLEEWVCPGISYTLNGYAKRFTYWSCTLDPPYRQQMVPTFATIGGVYNRWCIHPLTATVTGNVFPVSPTVPDDFDMCVGNPCDPATGNKIERENDYQSPALTFTRAYTSLQQVDRTEQGFGARWTHNFGQRLVFGPVANSDIYWQRADGRMESFYYNGATTFRPRDGTGTEIRLESGEWVVYQNSGARAGFGAAGSSLSGKMLWSENVAGQRTSLTYNGSGQLTDIVGPFGHTIQLTYTGDNITSMTDPDSKTTTYTYTNDVLTKVTYSDTTERTYHYEDVDLPQHLTGITDENSDRYSTFAYDDWGRAISTEHAGGYERFDLVYNANNTTTATDALGNVTTYAFRPGTRVPEQQTKFGGYDYRWWTSWNRPSIVRDAKGHLTRLYYNNYQMNAKLDAAGRLSWYYYLNNETDKLTRTTSPSVYSGSDREVVMTYNAAGLPDSVTINGFTPSGTAVSRSISMAYNVDGQVTSIDGPLAGTSDTTTFDYWNCSTGNECGQLKKVTNALGHITDYDSYDAHGRVTQITDPNGLVTTYAYDLRGRPTTVTETPPTGPARTTTYAYDDAGQLETLTAPNGTVLTYAYDAAHNLTSITDNLGNKIEYGYDLAGNRTDEDIKDSLGTLMKTLDYTYDARNRIDTINSAGSVTDVLFDVVGNMTNETDPNTNSTTHTYDGMKRLTQTLDALSNYSTFTYDNNDELISVVAPNGATTTYQYDDLGNLLTLSSPDTGTTTYTYDAAGNRLTQTDANSVTVTYTYDLLNRLLTVDYPTSSLDVTLTYDGGTNQKGRLTTMVDDSGTTTFSYNVFGNLTEESKVVDGNTHVTGYSYDAAGLLAEVTYPSGRTVDYTRNVLGQVTQVDTTYDLTTQTVASGIAYEPFGPLSELTFGNTLVMDRAFDQQYRLTGQDTGLIQDLTFTSDAASNIDAITDGITPALSQTFAQDVLHRITQDDGDYGDQDYTYDGVGNRLTRVHDDNGVITTQTLTYTANSNRLSTHDGVAVTIDAAGNTTADTAQNLTFSYGDHNRMDSASVGGVVQATFTYNGQGQRVKKVEATGSQRTFVFHYGLDGELLGETVYNNVGGKIEERDYLWVDMLPVAQSERAFSGVIITGSSFTYIHADQLNTPRLGTDSSGTVVWRWDSDAFGVGAADLDPDNDLTVTNVRLRFPGQYLDEETGVHYNYFRTYDPSTGRYIESDPIGLQGGLNTYLYTLASPTAFTDFYGLSGTRGRLPATQPTTAQVAASARVRNLVEQLQLLEPQYQYRTYRRWQDRYNRRDVEFLQRELQRAWQDSCFAPGHAPRQPNRFNPNQDALIQLAKQSKRGPGLRPPEANTMIEWAREYGVPSRGPEQHPNRPHGRNPHIHVGPINHIPVRKE